MDRTNFDIDRPFALSADDVLARLGSAPTGLTPEEAARRLDEVGPNRLPPPEKDGLLKRFFKHFNDALIYVLLIAAAITAALGHWVDTGVILGVVILNAVIGFIQEGKAEQALDGIRRMLSLHAHVRRGADWTEIDAEMLVPGDIVRLRSGARVPADVRLLQAVNLRVEESALTGESVPSTKREAPAADDAGVGDRHSMAFSGTLVAAGRGIGVVTSTGVHTEIGRINRMIAEVETLATPLTRQMAAFGKVLSLGILALAALMFVTGWVLHDYTATELFSAAIGFAVAAIPEGLPAILTITLAIGVQQMARRNAITRKLNAVETLGSVTVICSDKTGTLTRNEMTARDVVTPGGQYAVEGTGYRPDGCLTLTGAAVPLETHPDLAALVEAVAICNDTQIVQTDGEWIVVGEPTEGALVTLATKAGFDTAGYQRLAVVPFESERKYMATLDRTPDDRVRILMKGAPDRLLDASALQRGADGVLVPVDRGWWEGAVDRLSAQGLRVLAAASRDAEDAHDLHPGDVERDMVFLGVIGIIDPPRPEAIDAIALCQRAGIVVKMITGDHAGTALAIGREMGIGGSRAVTGHEIENASDEQLRHIVQEHDIFARTSPEHKLRLVQALQANDEVVAMTGDGVNDAPALKRADVGVAMGIKGTEATKEAAEIVLADDNFASISRAVAEGRTIYDNLRKAIIFILPTNGAEALVMFAAVVLGLVLPLQPVQILWVNMVTAVTLALALAFEPAEAGVMKRPPRDPGAPILGGYFLWRIAFVSMLIGGATIGIFLVAKEGRSIELARTVAVNTLVFGQAFYLFNCRALRDAAWHPSVLVSNGIAWAAVGVLVLVQLLFVYAPFMNVWFGSAPLQLQHWLVPIAIGFVVFVVVEIEKAVYRTVRPLANVRVRAAGPAR